MSLLRVGVLLTTAIWALSADAQESSALELPDGVVWPENLEWHDIRGNQREIETRFGRVDIAYEGNQIEGAVNLVRISLDGKLVGEPIPRWDDFGIVLVREVFELESGDAVLIGATAGGSGSPPEQLVMLSLSADREPRLFIDPELRSVDGTERIASDDKRIYFDLGYDTEQRKTATFGNGRVEVMHAAARAIPLSEGTCRYLIDAVNSICALDQPLPQMVIRSLNRLDQRPGFERDRVLSLCDSVRRTRTPQDYEPFRAAVCQPAQ